MRIQVPDQCIWFDADRITPAAQQDLVGVMTTNSLHLQKILGIAQIFMS